MDDLETPEKQVLLASSPEAEPKTEVVVQEVHQGRVARETGGEGRAVEGRKAEYTLWTNAEPQSPPREGSRVRMPPLRGLVLRKRGQAFALCDHESLGGCRLPPRGA